MSTMPPNLAALADGHYTSQTVAARQIADLAQALWNRMPSEGLRQQYEYWLTVAPDLVKRIIEAQAAAAIRSGDYVDKAALIQGSDMANAPRINPGGFVSPAEQAEEWLASPMHHYARTTMLGAPAYQARQAGLSTLVRIASTMVQDASREATGVAVAAHPDLRGYYRKLTPPSCKRCAVLAGGFYAWADAFPRHPNCDCVHVPAAERYDDATFDVADAAREGLIKDLNKGEYEAIVEHGANPAQVINASRKGAVSYTQMYGKRVQTTSSGYGLTSRFRLTPREIYRQAKGDKERARELLIAHRYLYG